MIAGDFFQRKLNANIKKRWKTVVEVKNMPLHSSLEKQVSVTLLAISLNQSFVVKARARKLYVLKCFCLYLT